MTENDGLKHYYIANIIWNGENITVTVDLDDLAKGATGKLDIKDKLDDTVHSEIFHHELNTRLFTDFT